MFSSQFLKYFTYFIFKRYFYSLCHTNSSLKSFYIWSFEPDTQGRYVVLPLGNSWLVLISVGYQWCGGGQGQLCCAARPVAVAVYYTKHAGAARNTWAILVQIADVRCESAECAAHSVQFSSVVPPRRWVTALISTAVSAINKVCFYYSFIVILIFLNVETYFFYDY